MGEIKKMTKGKFQTKTKEAYVKQINCKNKIQSKTKQKLSGKCK